MPFCLRNFSSKDFNIIFLNKSYSQIPNATVVSMSTLLQMAKISRPIHPVLHNLWVFLVFLLSRLSLSLSTPHSRYLLPLILTLPIFFLSYILLQHIVSFKTRNKADQLNRKSARLPLPSLLKSDCPTSWFPFLGPPQATLQRLLTIPLPSLSPSVSHSSHAPHSPAPLNSKQHSD